MTHYPLEPDGAATPRASAGTSTKEQAADAAQAGKQAAADVASTAADSAKDVAREAGDQARELTNRTRGQLREQVSTQQGALVETLRSLGDQLAGMTDHAEQGGMAVDLAGRARDRARSAADWLDGRDPDDLLNEMRKIGRNRPVAFLLSTALAGVAAGRLTRGVVAVHADDDGGAGMQNASPGRHEAAGDPAGRPSPGVTDVSASS